MKTTMSAREPPEGEACPALAAGATHDEEGAWQSVLCAGEWGPWRMPGEVRACGVDEGAEEGEGLGCGGVEVTAVAVTMCGAFTFR